MAEYERLTNIKGGWAQETATTIERNQLLIKYADTDDKRQLIKQTFFTDEQVNKMSDREVDDIFKSLVTGANKDEVELGFLRKDIEISDSMVATAINNKYEAQAAQAERERQNEIDAYGELFGDDERGKEIYEQTN